MRPVGCCPAQAGKSTIGSKLTMGVYTDPRLLDVRGALDALPSLSLQGDQARPEIVRATGTDGAARVVAPTVAPTSDNSVQERSNPVLPFTGEVRTSVAVSGSPDKNKGRLSTCDNRPSCRGERIRTSDLLNPIHRARHAKCGTSCVFSSYAVLHFPYSTRFSAKDTVFSAISARFVPCTGVVGAEKVRTRDSLNPTPSGRRAQHGGRRGRCILRGGEDEPRRTTSNSRSVPLASPNLGLPTGRGGLCYVYMNRLL